MVQGNGGPEDCEGARGRGRPDGRLIRILIVTDAWEPQVNGVVRTYQSIGRELPRLGVEPLLLTPQRFFTVPFPAYPEVALAVAGAGHVGRQIEAMAPDYIHIATEGPLGWAARHWCIGRGRRFTTSYHTRFPEYLETWLKVPSAWTYAALRRFHNSGAGCMVATGSLRAELAGRGFSGLMPWTRGADLSLFHPRPDASLGLERPVFLSVGRVAAEKNLAAFLDLDLPGSKVVVGDGPALPALRAAYPDVHFLGTLAGEALAEAYAAADVFVFPSRLDTFGVVLVEALASGLPVAAYPVTGPIDVIGDSGAGVLAGDLRSAALAALDIPRERCPAAAARYRWPEAARQFLDNIVAANLAADPVADPAANAEKALAA